MNNVTEIKLDDIKEKLRALSPDIGDEDTELAETLPAAKPQTWDRRQAFHTDRDAGGGFRFTWDSGPLQGQSYTRRTLDDAIKAGNRGMDLLPAHEHIKYLYDLSERQLWPVYEDLNRIKRSAKVGNAVAAVALGLSIGLVVIKAMSPAVITAARKP